MISQQAFTIAILITAFLAVTAIVLFKLKHHAKKISKREKARTETTAIDYDKELETWWQEVERPSFNNDGKICS